MKHYLVPLLLPVGSEWSLSLVKLWQEVGTLGAEGTKRGIMVVVGQCHRQGVIQLWGQLEHYVRSPQEGCGCMCVREREIAQSKKHFANPKTDEKLA